MGRPALRGGARLAGEWGYDGLEIACWGDHLDVSRGTTRGTWRPGSTSCGSNGLGVWAISNHLTGQAVCDDPIDERHKAIVPRRVWGDGEPEGVRRRAAEDLKDTARMAARLGVRTVVGFTGSSIWKTVAMFPPVPAEMVAGRVSGLRRPLEPDPRRVRREGVRFAHEVHPSEIAYDYWTTKAALEAMGAPYVGLNWDPSHMIWQPVNPVGFLVDFADRIYHVDCKDTKMQTGNGRNARLLAPTCRGRTRAAAGTSSSVGLGDVPWGTVLPRAQRDRL